ncbi:type III secretion system chaperone [Brevifollis gellanilyticus]|uniref:Uncharacterized protein n=1 Tax=Brevifollis gellanilyticus TaxID=748831 RepID=A0A512MAF7_9BACT|nr:type III secretion system chaperone [Brevifollis gellanilyticus]GEP43703.1 hypothetical protein BGE01nite_29940 [Brevifollis gellanilyticus]
MSLEQLLASLATELDLPDLALSENGTCQLTFDDKLSITIEQAPQEDSAHVYATVGRAPESDREDFFAALLEAQLFSREVGEGCTLGLDRSTDEVLLCRKLRLADLDEAGFSSALTEFMNWSEHWLEKLAGDITGPQEPESDGFTLNDHFIRA